MSDRVNNFSQSIKQLNQEQKLAVETTEGAVMVLAGPGTGKTQVVALRIAQILKKTHMDPTNILSLTFTEAGVAALRRRLISIIGNVAYKVTISTFHGFSNEVIGIFPHLFTHTQTLRQITDAERFILIEEILQSTDSLKLLRPLRKPDLYVNEISQKIKTVKQEAVSPKLFKEIINTTDEKQRDKLMEFVEIYKKYNKELFDRGWYDYEDTIRFVVDALKDNEEVKSYFQERYQYILVDEYQDTNNSQNKLIEALADFYKNPNLFVVGDDKQAIYRFQGASVANMLLFKNKYPEMKVITLKKNYRSSPEILKIADKLIANNKTQISKLLGSNEVALRATKKRSSKPTIHTTNSYLSQYEEIIEIVKKYKKSGTPLSSTAVLWRKRQDVKGFADYALKSGISVSGQVIKQITEDPSIGCLIKVLKAIKTPSNNIYIIAALKQVLDDKDLVELYKINRSSRRATILIEKLIKSSKQIKKEVSKIMEAHRLSETLTVQELMEWLVANTPYVNNIFNNKDLAGAESLVAFYDSSKNFSKQNSNGLADFLNYINAVKERNLEISIPKLLPDNGLYTGTVHSVKGMEFDRVIIAGADEKKWTIKKRPELIKLPSKIIGLNKWEDNTEEDERRLFYVAITRARKSLDITYSSKNIDGADVLRAQFVEELGNLKENIVTNTLKRALESSKRNIFPIDSEMLSKQELDYARHVIRTSPFSFSDIRAYNICPKQYYLSRVLRLPQPESEALMYGNVVHGALESFFREFRSYRSIPSKSRFIELVDESAKKTASPRLYKKLLEHSVDVLSRYYDEKSHSWSIPVGIEYSFTHHQVRLDDVWLTGKYDRIDMIDSTSKSVRVVDYKTKARSISRNEIEGNTKNSDGLIKKQLIFYGLLAKNDSMFPYLAREFMISVIDDSGKFKDEIIDITRDDINNLEKEIISTKKEILSLNSFNHTRDSFDQGCELCEMYS